MKVFLNLKSWQFFTLIVGPLLIREIFPFGSYAFDLANSFALIIISTIFLLWASSVVNYSIAFIKNRKFLSRVLFNSCGLLFFGYMIVLSFLLLNKPLFNDLIFLIMPVHFVVMLSIFYIIYFIARVIKEVEGKNGSLVKFFAAVWFFPVGIWWLQPKVNKMLLSVQK